LKHLVVEALPAVESKRSYGRALDHFYQWYLLEQRGPFNKAVVQQYRVALEKVGYSASTIALRLSALRLLATEAADNGQMDPNLAAGIARARGPKRLGRRLGNWLESEGAARFLMTPGTSTTKGLRDRAILAVGIGCGLRRGEIAALSLEQLQIREGRWVVVDIAGKHGRIRSVPMVGWVKAFIDEWLKLSDTESGRVFRSVDKAGRITGDSMTGQAIYEVVTTWATRAGLNVTPHDLHVNEVVEQVH
jgi:integrase/recombinase XerD